MRKKRAKNGFVWQKLFDFVQLFEAKVPESLMISAKGGTATFRISYELPPLNSSGILRLRLRRVRNRSIHPRVKTRGTLEQL